MTALLSSPELGPNTLTPRPYQAEAIEAARAEFRAKRKSTMVVLPTGMGKTALFALAARSCVERGGRALVVVHRKELVHDAANTLERVGLHPAVELGGEHARTCFDPHAVAASLQSISGRKRLASWPRDYFKLIVVDECHHSVATTYQRVLAHFGSARVLGVTATPDRADGEDVMAVFESVAYEMTLWDGITAPHPGPWLSPLTIVKCMESIDLRGIRTTGARLKDFSKEQLEERIRPMVGVLANAIKSKIADRQTIIFTPDCGSASAMAAALASIGVSAAYVWGDSPDRDKIVAEYRAGRLRVMVNASLFTEGFDAPATSAVVPLRPTKSRGLFSQMVGRGTRLATGKKDCLLIDFGWLTDEHDFVRPADLFDRDVGVRNALAEILDKPGEPVDLVAASRAAERTASRRAAIEIQAKERETRLKFVTYDAASTAGVMGIETRGAVADARHAPATMFQIAALKRFGVADPSGASKRFASQLLDVLGERARKGLATAKQTAALIRNGVEPSHARAMTFQEASAHLDAVIHRRA